MMPHSTSSGSSRRDPSLNRSSGLKAHSETNGDLAHATEKFPDLDTGSNGRSASPWKQDGYANGPATAGDRWQPRRNSRVTWAPNEPQPFSNNRQRRISNAIGHIRSGSMGQNAHELADALRAPISYKLIVRPFCSYTTFVKNCSN
jgi:solute carrier family 35 protein E1